jgi:hypothetical protein
MSCCNGGAKPKITRVVKEALLTAANVVGHAITKGELAAPSDLIQRRVDLCMKCPHLNGQRCSICACFVHQKAALKNAHCPINKW